MATTLTYTVASFLPFTKIVSADMNTYFTDIKNRVNWDGSGTTTGLGDDNVQSNSVSGGGLTRSSKLKAGTADYVVINDATGLLSEEAQLATTRGGLGFSPTISSATAGQGVVVNDAGTALSLGTPNVDRLTESLAGDVSDIVAGEAISARDAVCLDLSKDASNNDIYKVFVCDADLPTRNSNFIGFATAAATVTAHTLTWTDDAALVTSNTITFDVNDRSYSAAFNTDNDTTLSNIATTLAADPDIQSASVVDAGSNDRVINVTGVGSRYVNIQNATVTGGASQAGIAIATTQAPAGDAVSIRVFGPISGFSGLTTGSRYSLSGTAGSITTAPPNTNSLFVGQALSATVLFVNKNAANFNFTTPDIFITTHGSPAGYTVTGIVATAAHFNYTSWSAGTSDSVTRGRLNIGESHFNTNLYAVDGVNSSAVPTALTNVYNKSSWSAAGSNRATTRSGSAVGNLLGNLVLAMGSTNGDQSGGGLVNDTWNGSAWTVGTAYTGGSGGIVCPGGFVYSNVFHVVGGINTANSEVTDHETWNGTSIGSATVLPIASQGCGSGETVSGNAIILAGGSSAYQWSGSWSSAIAIGYTYEGTDGQESICTMSGYSSGTQRFYTNGGTSAATTSINTTSNFNGTSFTSDTSSTDSLCAGQGAVI